MLCWKKYNLSCLRDIRCAYFPMFKRWFKVCNVILRFSCRHIMSWYLKPSWTFLTPLRRTPTFKRVTKVALTPCLWKHPYKLNNFNQMNFKTKSVHLDILWFCLCWCEYIFWCWKFLNASLIYVTVIYSMHLAICIFSYQLNVDFLIWSWKSHAVFSYWSL